MFTHTQVTDQVLTTKLPGGFSLSNCHSLEILFKPYNLVRHSFLFPFLIFYFLDLNDRNNG